MNKKLGTVLTCTALAATMSACSGVTQGAGGETLTFATVPGFDDTVAVTALWEALLEERNYNVETRSVDLAAGFSGIARGDLDGYLNAWLPSTHEAYIEEYRDELVVLDENGPYFDDNRLALVVPESVEEQTIADLVDNAQKYDSKIIGIEAGSGLMNLLPEVLETYNAKDAFQVVEGSTPAALAELERAAQDNDPTAVTLWTPHWAFASMDIKTLEDPAGGWPAPDGSYVVVSQEFPEEHAEVAEWMSNFKLTEEQYASLMLAVNEADDPVEGARSWLETPENKETAEGWFN